MLHSSVARNLRIDVRKKYDLKNELEKKQSLVASLTRKLKHAKKKRLNNRYSGTIKRLNTEISMLMQEINKTNMDLQERIKHEMEFSEEEVSKLREQYQKEYAEMVGTENKLKAIEAGTAEPDVEETAEEEPVSKEVMEARAKRVLKAEKKIVDEIQKEINTEEKDKVFFTRELQYIMAELDAHEEN